jgi:anti-sigma B factor antagonist
MSEERFQADNGFEMAERHEPEHVVLVLSGELDFGTAGAVQQRLAELRELQRAVVLDLDRLTFMDSTGIRLVLTAAEDASRCGWRFHVTRGSARVRHVLEAAQVIERLPYAERDEP